mmetsp:Transcript_66572/g.173215  ORF Transcript_66572/g.173215 Transcript_66572/m.173215 type:complete len:232 (-) Transcript_66572:13-708(-)
MPRAPSFSLASTLSFICSAMNASAPFTSSSINGSITGASNDSAPESPPAARTRRWAAYIVKATSGGKSAAVLPLPLPLPFASACFAKMPVTSSCTLALLGGHLASTGIIIESAKRLSQGSTTSSTSGFCSFKHLSTLTMPRALSFSFASALSFICSTMNWSAPFTSSSINGACVGESKDSAPESPPAARTSKCAAYIVMATPGGKSAADLPLPLPFPFASACFAKIFVTSS